MTPFTTHRGLVAPLPRRDVDTDQIIPKQFLTSTARSGFGEALFHHWRRQPDGAPDPGFVLNQPKFAGASILVAGANFGCGSSREHAVWALADFGFRVVIAPSFADIFAANALNNGLLTVAAPDDLVAELVARAVAREGYTLDVDLRQCKLRDDAGLHASFAMTSSARDRLLRGVDAIDAILEHEPLITAYERGLPRYIS
jgi:3-isopropylmalate/(R)-2-methylmalate dehydratase small subunit